MWKIIFGIRGRFAFWIFPKNKIQQNQKQNNQDHWLLQAWIHFAKNEF